VTENVGTVANDSNEAKDCPGIAFCIAGKVAEMAYALVKTSEMDRSADWSNSPFFFGCVCAAISVSSFLINQLKLESWKSR
jgi:hypothetical protein